MATYYVDEYGNVTKKGRAKKKSKDNASYFVDLDGTVTRLDDDDDLAPLVSNAKARASEDIAPVKSTVSEDRTWFQKGAFEDGYQLGDLSKSLYTTFKDVRQDAVEGAVGIGEKVVDAGAYLVGGVGKLLGADEFASDMQRFIEKDIINEEKVAKFVIGDLTDLAPWQPDVEKNSLLGDKSDSLVQSAGQLGATIGLQAVGVPWYLTTGATSFGGEVESGFKQGATYGEAGLSAAITAGAEILTEKISGGIKFGGKALDDGLTREIARRISSKTVSTLAKLGMDAVGEGSEEVLSGIMSAIGQKLTYADDKQLNELFSSEDALEAFIGGAVLGGGMTGINIGKNAIEGKGRDIASGLTANESAVVDRVYQDRVAEQEKSGKITEKEKRKIYDEVLSELDRGGLSIDTIEEVLGGETYSNYKKLADAEATMQAEYDALGKKEKYTLADDARYKELGERLKYVREKGAKSELKARLDSDVASMVEGSRLSESFAERSRRGQKFEADVSKYDEKQRAIVQKAVDSGILNNTRRTHEFVDMVARIAADRGLSFDFTNNAKLKESGFAVEGKTVNGFVTKDGITVNIQSAKSLNSVVGHEITHVLEGTELYAELQQAVFQYAETKKDLAGRRGTLTALYQNVEGANIDAELTADLVGDYLFTDADFINNLSTNHRNVFQKIYDEVKYLLKMATAGSKEARQLEQVKHAFEKAYRGSRENTGDSGVKYSVYSRPNFNAGEWAIVNRRKHSEFANPNFDLDTDKKWMYATEKGHTVFAIYSKHDAEDPTVLYGSSGKKAEQDYAKLKKFFEEGQRYAGNNRATFDRLLNDVKSAKRNAGDGISPAGERGTTTGDVFLPFGESGSNGRENYGNGAENRQATLTEYNDEASDDSGASFVTFGSDYAAVRNFMKDGDTSEDAGSGTEVKYSLVEDQGTIDFLENQEHITVYKAMSLIDGKLYPPMASQTYVEEEYTTKSGEKKTRRVRKLKSPSVLGRWQQAEERPDIAEQTYDPKKGYSAFDLLKSNGKTTGGVAYNPYEHTSNIVLNDQFSEAYQRPELVTVEYEIPVSELTSGYKAQYAKDPVGRTDWKAGGVAQKLQHGHRDVYLTRWSKPVRVLSDAEVAQKYKEILDKEEGISVPWNVVTPSLRQELERIGVPIDYSDIKAGSTVRSFEAAVRGDYEKPKKAKKTAKYSLASDSEGRQLSAAQREYFKDSKVVDNEGRLKVMYHGTQDGGFHEFSGDYSDDAISFFFTDSNDVAASYSGSAETYAARTLRTADDLNKLFAEVGATEYTATEEDGTFRLLEDGDEVAESDSAEGLYEEFRDWTGLGSGSVNYQAYLNLVNPLVVDAEGGDWHSLPSIDRAADKYEYIKVVEVLGKGVRIEYSMVGDPAPTTEVVDLYDKFEDNLADTLSNMAPGEVVEGAYANPATTRDYARYAKEHGYDGVIFKNIYDIGGYGSNGATESTVAIAFSPEQIKSVANAKPTADPDIRFSLSADSEGRQLAPGVAKRFANSKVVDENGDLRVVYHGTTYGEFSVFSKEHGNVENDFGVGFYFSSSDSDVSEHYDGGGPDFENKVARRAEQIEAEEDIDYEEAEQRAREELFRGGHKFEVYLNIENPAIVGETTLFSQDEALEEYDEADYDDYDDYIADVEQLVADKIESIVWDVERKTDAYSVEGLADVLFEAYYEGGIGVEELKGKINDLYLGDENGNLIGNEVVRQIIESLGYDGIIDPTVSGKWNMDMEEGTTHYIAFRPEQIKAVTNETPTDNPDIHRSLSKPGAERRTFGSYNVRGEDVALEDIAPVRQDIATVSKNATVQEAAVYEEPAEEESPYAELDRLTEEAEDLERQMYAAMDAGENDRAMEINADLVDAAMRITALEQQLDADVQDRLTSFTDEDAPIVREAPYSESADTVTLPKKMVQEIARDARKALAFSPKKVAKMRELVEKFASGEIDSETLYDEIAYEFSTYTESIRNEDVAEVKKWLRGARINVSDDIKSSFADYTSSIMRPNSRKIIFSKDGAAVDQLYAELADLFPGFFPSDIIQPADQLQQIIDVANMDINTEGVHEIDGQTLDEVTNDIVRRVNEYRRSQRYAAAEANSRAAFNGLMADADRYAPVMEGDLGPVRADVAPAVPVAEPAVDKDSFISKRAAELYDEISNLKKGVKASPALGHLLDHGYEWRTIKTALLNIRDWPSQRVDFNSAAESVARETIYSEYEDYAYTMSEAQESAPAEKQSIKTVKERLAAKLQNLQTELAENKRLREESRVSYDVEIARLQAEYYGKRDKNTKAANNLLRRIERLRRIQSDIDPDHAKRISDLEAQVAKASEEARTGASPEAQGAMRRELHARKIEEMRARLAERGIDFDEMLKNAKDLSTIATVDNTPQRVMEKALGYKEGQALADLTVNQVAQHETEGIRWLNGYTDRKNGLLAQISKQYGIKPGTDESAAAQMYAEGFYVAENGDIIEYGDRELAKDFPDAKMQANIKGLARDPRIRQIYDATLAMINESRARNAYPEIQKLDNYFLHFRAMDDTFSRLGIPFNPNDIRAKDLPTDLNGVTADLKPGQPYFASAMHRKGKRTSFDLLGGLERYLTSAKNQIYHIDDIQTFRALRNHIAETYGQAHGLEGLDGMTEEEAAAQIEQVYDAHLSTFAKFLNEEANVIAGKTALIDRGLEGIIGRRGMTFFDTLNRQVGANMVGFNVSSALTNFIAPVQAFAKTNKAAFVKGFAQTVANRVASITGKTDSFIENNPTMIRRKGADQFYRTPWQKVADIGYALMGGVDSFSTEVIVRGKYNELVSKGMGHEQAVTETDKWTSRLMGDRSLGQQPQLYNSKMLGLITKFQLEVRNQLDSQFYDTIQEAKVSAEDIQNKQARNAKIAAQVTSTWVTLAVAQHLFGKAFESVAGYNPAFDIIEAIIKAFGWDDEEDSEDTVLDNLGQGFMSLLEDMPYSSVATGGRIPIASALPVAQLIKGKDQYGNEKSRLETIAETAPYWLLPGGYGQIKKTVQGLGMFDEDLPIAGSYTDSGNLRYPVEDTFANRAQAAIFGQYASANARDYFDNERQSLKKNQIQELVDVDMPIREYWDYRDGLKEQETLAEKFDYIAGLDLPIDKKNILINNVVDRKEAVDLTDYDLYADYEEFDFAVKNPEKYDFLQSVGVSVAEYQSFDDDTKDAYNWAYENPDKYQVSRAVTSDVAVYRQYTKALNDIKADKNADGNSISGSRKAKVVSYLNNLDADYYTKIILFKMEYNADDTYNREIIEYLNGRNDISFEEEVTILKELGFTVTADGTVRW